MSDAPEPLIYVFARQRLNRPDAYISSVTFLNPDDDGIDGTLVELSDPDAPPFKSGPRKGQPNWSKVGGRQKIIITRPEFEAMKLEWIAETGRCGECLGTTEIWTGWSHDTGSRFVPCRACNATGSAITEASS